MHTIQIMTFTLNLLSTAVAIVIPGSISMMYSVRTDFATAVTAYTSRVYRDVDFRHCLEKWPYRCTMLLQSQCAKSRLVHQCTGLCRYGAEPGGLEASELILGTMSSFAYSLVYIVPDHLNNSCQVCLSSNEHILWTLGCAQSPVAT